MNYSGVIIIIILKYGSLLRFPPSVRTCQSIAKHRGLLLSLGYKHTV